MKIANRHLLYAEALAGWFSFSAGISVGFSKGMLWAMVHALGDGASYAALLGAPLVLGGVLLMSVCALEVVRGRDWREDQLLLGSRARQYLSLVLCLANAAVLVALIQLEALWKAPMVTLNCVALIVFFAFAAFKARRLCFALDPRYLTARLREELPRSW